MNISATENIIYYTSY